MFVGANTAFGDEAIFSIWHRPGLWVVTSAFGVRELALDNLVAGGFNIPDGSITRSKLDPDTLRYGPLNIENSDFTLLQEHEIEAKIWTGGSILTVPYLIPGSQFVIKRATGTGGLLQATGTNVEFDFENNPQASFALSAGKTVTLVMRPNSTKIDVLGG